MCAAIKIRAARTDDAQRIAYVRITGWRQSYRGMMPDILLDNLDIDADITRVQKALADPNNRSMRFVAEKDGIVIGMAACGAARGQEDVERGEVYALYLLDEVKRTGAGTLMMRHMARALEQQGMRSLQLSVLEKNTPARAFYEKLGGKLVGKGTFTFEGHALPDVTYVWERLSALAV